MLFCSNLEFKGLSLKFELIQNVTVFSLSSNAKPESGIVYYFQCCGSGMFIPDPASEFFQSRILHPYFFPSRIPDRHQRI
jgi:hypothetical protein